MMKKTIKRILSLLLCVSMLVGVMSGNALAAKATKKSKKVNKAYSKIIRKYENQDSSGDYMCYYSFFDMTGDSTKELIITSGRSEQGKYHDVFTYKNGKAKKVGSFWAWHSHLGYKKKKKLLNYQWHWSGATIQSVRIKNGKVKEKEVFYFSEETDPDTTLEKKLKKKGYNNIKWLKTCNADDLSLLKKTFPR